MVTAISGFMMLILLSFAGPVMSTALADTIHVDDDNCPGPGDGSELNPYCSIQDAIDAATSGVDEVLVHDGIYKKIIDDDKALIDFSGKAIIVRSENGWKKTTIDGDRKCTVVEFTWFEGEDSVLDGFTVTGGSANQGGGIACYNSSPTITNCMIRGNSVYSEYIDENRWDAHGGGIVCDWASPIIKNCTITDNETRHYPSSGDKKEYGGGIYCHESSPLIINSNITDNESTQYGGGMYIDGSSSSPSIINCTFSANEAYYYKGGGAIYCGENVSLSVVNSIFWEDAHHLGIPHEIYLETGSTATISYSNIDASLITGSATPTLNNNINMDPLFIGNGDCHLTADSPCIDTGTSNTVTYPELPADDIDGESRPKDVNHDIGSDEHSAVPTHYGSIQAAINAATHGRTIIVRDGTYIENINFLGKAITVVSENGSEHTTIDGNNNGSAVTLNSGEGADSVLDGFTVKNGSGTVSGNTTRGGGIDCRSASPSIRNCIIQDNDISNINVYGGGVYCDEASPVLANCVIRNNQTSGFGGGGIYCRSSSSPSIYNCTITNNFGFNGGGIYSQSSSPTVRNSILWGDTSGSGAHEISLSGGSTIDITYSAIQDNDPDDGSIYPGTGNIDVLPLLINPRPPSEAPTTAGDYHLQDTSPCIDEGSNAHVPIMLTEDMDGDDRIMDGDRDTIPVVDMGADEVPPPNQCEGDFDWDGDVDGSDLAVFAPDVGRTDCDTGDLCEGDFNGDFQVDETDLARFASDFGRQDCLD